jgi:hypothetical protein
MGLMAVISGGIFNNFFTNLYYFFDIHELYFVTQDQNSYFIKEVHYVQHNSMGANARNDDSAGGDGPAV